MLPLLPQLIAVLPQAETFQLLHNTTQHNTLHSQQTTCTQQHTHHPTHTHTQHHSTQSKHTTLLGDYTTRCVPVDLGREHKPTSLTVIEVNASKGTTKTFVPAPQLKLNVCFALGISKSTFYRALYKLRSNKRVEAPLHLLQSLKASRCIPFKSPTCVVLSLNSCHKVLGTLNIPKAVVNSLSTQGGVRETPSPTQGVACCDARGWMDEEEDGAWCCLSPSSTMDGMESLDGESDVSLLPSLQSHQLELPTADCILELWRDCCDGGGEETDLRALFSFLF